MLDQTERSSDKPLDQLHFSQLNKSQISALRENIDRALCRHAELMELDAKSFEKYAREKWAADRKSLSAKRLERGAEYDRWAFFNEPRADANTEYWRTVSHFSPAEIVALSLGKEPSVVHPLVLSPFRRPLASPFRELFEARLSRIERAVDTLELSAPISREVFVDWASEHEVEYMNELERTAGFRKKKSRSDLETELSHANSENEILRERIKHLERESLNNPKSKNYLYRIILAMACRNYGWMTSTRSAAAKNISADLAGEPFMWSISQETINGHLSDAARELDIEIRNPLHPTLKRT